MEKSHHSRTAHRDTVVLPRELTVARAREAFDLLMKRVASGADIQVDAGAVSQVDTAGVQLLFVVQRALAETDRALLWTSASAQLCSAAALLGMSELLGLPARD